MKSMICGAALIALASLPVAAEAQDRRGSPANSERVSYADLDLTKPDGVSMLDRRIRGAAHRVCKQRGGPIILEPQRRVCVKKAFSGASPQVAAARTAAFAEAARTLMLSDAGR